MRLPDDIARVDVDAVVGEKDCDEGIAESDEVAENIGESIGDPIVDDRAELENVVGNANELGDAVVVGVGARAEPKLATFCPKTCVAIWAWPELSDKIRETSDDDIFPDELPAPTVAPWIAGRPWINDTGVH